MKLNEKNIASKTKFSKGSFAETLFEIQWLPTHMTQPIE